MTVPNWVPVAGERVRVWKYRSWNEPPLTKEYGIISNDIDQNGMVTIGETLPDYYEWTIKTNDDFVNSKGYRQLDDRFGHLGGASYDDDYRYRWEHWTRVGSRPNSYAWLERLG